MKRGKKTNKKTEKNKPKKKTLIILTIVLIILILLVIIFKNLPLTTKVIEKPQTPQNCSNESIKAVWKSVFKGSYENITIVNMLENYSDETNYSEEDMELYGIFFPRGCPMYNAYQINGNNIRIIFGTDLWFFMDMKAVIAMDAEYTTEEIENLTKRLAEGSPIDSTTFVMEEFLENKTLPRNINTTEEAKSKFESIFKISSSNWTKEEETDFENANVTLYGFVENETLGNITIFGESINPQAMIAKTGIVFQNYSINMYTYVDAALLNAEDLEKKFGNWTSPINTSVKNITIEVNNSKIRMSKELAIFSEHLSGIQKVEILENNQTRIETEVNFSNDFDWTKISMKKQEINSNKGYVIINGLNFTKNITVDRLNNKSESVCIKDKEINSISEISKGCNSTNEYLLECPGNINNFTCKISGDKFIVTGLKHSAVIEILPISEPCIPDWECDDWTDYNKNCGYRICTDLNNCRNDSTKPNESQKCPVCVPNWECTDFAPEKCPKSERRTRTCDDLNDCGTSKEEPNLTQSCKIETNWILIIGGILGGIIILIIIIMLTKGKKNEVQNPNSTQNSPKQPPSNPPPNYPKTSNYISPSNIKQGYNSNQRFNSQNPNQTQTRNYEQDYNSPQNL